jgi:xanthine dehydrogenase small subunit
MIKFILNDTLISTNLASGTTLLDFIRYERSLTGTKTGCREGDCGACTVLVGELSGDEVRYRSITCCISPLGNAHGKHIVTVEGIADNEMNRVQQAMVNNGGTQCGFCTPGFVVSLTGATLSNKEATYEQLEESIDGNICRCTGYKSIQRAVRELSETLLDKDVDQPVAWACSKGLVPAYFTGISARLKEIEPLTPSNGAVVSGGTDVYVQRHDDFHHSNIHFFAAHNELKSIVQNEGVVRIGAAATASDLLESSVMRSLFPRLKKHLQLVSSTPIRNMGSIAGNFVNASPIGDLTCFFIALGSRITLRKGESTRTILLKDFYKGYKILDKGSDEHIAWIEFDAPGPKAKFNFEKVSKRTYLDIASVNSSIQIELDNNIISSVYLSAGGVAPTPLYLSKTCGFMKGKEITAELICEAAEVVQQEISPISDARGDASYKRLLMRQLFFAHFIELFPETVTLEELI